MNIKNCLKKLLLISTIVLFGGCATTPTVRVTNIQPCIPPPSEYVTDTELAILFDSPDHICAPDQMSNLVKIIAKMKKQIKVQKNALDCYQTQFDTLGDKENTSK